MFEATLAENLDMAYQDPGIKTLEKAFRDCDSRLGRPAKNLEVCEELGLSLRGLYRLLDLYRGIGLGRVDDFETSDDDGVEPVVKYVPDPADETSFMIYPKSEFRIAMANAFDALPKNEKLVVSLHHHENLTMQEIAQIFGISEMRVAQIHTTAMLRVRGKLQSLNGA